MNKRFLALLSCLALALCLTPVTAQALPDPVVPEVIFGTKVYANGVPITIEAGSTAGYSMVSYLNGQSKEYLLFNSSAEADLSGYKIYGGAYTDVVASASVTLSDGVVGTIFGGGEDGAVTSTSVLIRGGTVDTVYGGGEYGNVTGHASVLINGGTVATVYGGGHAGDAGSTGVTVDSGGFVKGAHTEMYMNSYAVFGGGYQGNVTGRASVTVNGGKIGERYIFVDADNDRWYRVSGNIFGGGCGGGDSNNGGTVGSASVTVNGGEIKGDVYGGGAGASATAGGTVVTITGGKTIGCSYDLKETDDPKHGDVYGGGNSGAVTGQATTRITGGDIAGYVFGGGRGNGNGRDTRGYGTVGSTSVTVEGGTLRKSVFGGGNFGPVTGQATTRTTGGEIIGYVSYNASHEGHVYGGGMHAKAGSTEVTIEDNSVIYGDVYGGGYSEETATNLEAKVTGSTSVTIRGGTVGKEDGSYGGDVLGGGLAAGVDGSANVTISGGTVYGCVFGGSWEDGTVGETHVNIETGANIGSAVYGGGNQGSVTGNTNVTVSGGTIGDCVYGGGLGSVGNNGDGSNIGKVSGNTHVEVSGGTMVRVHGGGGLASVTGDTNVTVSGGTVDTVYGGGIGHRTFDGFGRVDGSTNVTVSGGTVRGTVCGGSSGTGTVTGNKNGWLTAGVNFDKDTFDNLLGKDRDGNWLAKGNLFIPDAMSITVDAGKTMTLLPTYLENHGTVTVNGSLDVQSGGWLENWGTMTVNGTLTNGGTFEYVEGALSGSGSISGTGTFETAVLEESYIHISDTYVYTGSELSIENEIKILGQTFTFASGSWTRAISPAPIKNAGGYTATYRKTGAADIVKAFSVVKSGTVFSDGILTYNGGTPTTAFTYGDVITVKVTPKATGTPAANGASFARSLAVAPMANQMAIFCGTTQLTGPQTVASGTELTFAVHTANKQLPFGTSILTAKYIGDANMAAHDESVSITLSKKQLGAALVPGVSKTFDGSAAFMNVALSLNGVAPVDTLTATVNGYAADKNADTNKAFTVTSLTLSGAAKDYYVLQSGDITGTVTIAKAPAQAIADTAQRVSYGDTAEKSVPLTGRLPVNAGSLTYTAGTKIDADGIIRSFAVDADGNVKFALVSGLTPADKDKTATLPVVIQSQNYQDSTANVVVTVTEKQTQNLAYDKGAMTRVYGSAGFTNPLTQLVVNGAISYASSDTGVAMIDAGTGAVTVTGAGTATLTATAAETATHAEATASYTLTVTKRTLTVTAEDKSIVKGQAMPAFTYRAEGLANGDAFTTAPSMSSTAANTNTPGVYAISIAGGALRNAASYELHYVPGSLSIAERLYSAAVNQSFASPSGAGDYAAGQSVRLQAGVREGHTFIGWSAETGTAVFADEKSDMTTFIMPASDVIVRANWRYNAGAPTGGVHGAVTVYGGEPAVNVGVEIWQGTKKLAGTRTDANGEYSFNGLLYGDYNIIATNAAQIVTALIEIKDPNLTRRDLSLPPERISSTLTIADNEPDAPETPDIVVGGLDEVETQEPATGTTTVTLTVQSKAVDTEGNDEHRDIKELAEQESLDQLAIIEIKLYKDSHNIGDANARVLEFVIPFDLSDKTDVTLFRYHGSGATALTKLDARPAAPFADGTYFVDTAKNFIYLYAAKFSPYGFAYNLIPPATGGGSAISGGGGYMGERYAGGFTMGKNGALVLTVQAPCDKCVSVTVDNVQLTRDKDYTINCGSTIVTFTPSYLAGLKDGTHTVRVQFTDGRYDGTFVTPLSASIATAAMPGVPATGDAPIWAKMLRWLENNCI